MNEFQYLHELTKNAEAQISFEDNSKESRFFHLAIESDLADVAHEIGCEPSDKSFLMLRKVVYRKLLNRLLVINPKHIVKSKHLVYYAEVHRDFYISKFLMLIGFYNSGVKLARRVEKMSYLIEQWDIRSGIAGFLSDYYATRGELSNSKLYSTIWHESNFHYTNERRLKDLVNKWSSFFSRKSIPNKSDIEELKLDVSEAIQIKEKDSTRTIVHFYYRLHLFYLDALNDFEEVIKICDEALSELSKFDGFGFKNREGIYVGTKMYGYLNLRDFDNAKRFAKRVEAIFVEGTLNWYKINESYYVLSVQTENYDEAWVILHRALNNNNFSNLPASYREKWVLMEGYMEFIIQAGLWVKDTGETTKKKFRINRFANQVFGFHKDKQGTYVAILILQILFLIQQANYTAVIDKKEAIARYVRRYLYTKENERSRVFLSMLMKVIDFNFNAQLVEEKTKRLLDNLNKEKVVFSSNLGSNEIVNYELLWDWLMGALKENWTQSDLQYN